MADKNPTQAHPETLPSHANDATRAYLFLMQQTGGKLQVLPGDVYVLEERYLPLLTEKQIEFETIDQK